MESNAGIDQFTSVINVPDSRIDVTNMNGTYLIDIGAFPDAHMDSVVTIQDGIVTEANIRTPEIDNTTIAEGYYTTHGAEVQPFSPLRAVLGQCLSEIEADTYASTNSGQALTPSIVVKNAPIDTMADFINTVLRKYDHNRVLKEAESS